MEMAAAGMGVAGPEPRSPPHGRDFPTLKRREGRAPIPHRTHALIRPGRGIERRFTVRPSKRAGHIR